MISLLSCNGSDFRRNPGGRATENVTTHSHTATRSAGQFPFTSYARFLFFYALAAQIAELAPARSNSVNFMGSAR
jgi:hypothetical protein